MRALLVLLCLAALPLSGQEIRVRVQADTSIISVGDRITYTVVVEHAADEHVVWPNPDSLDLGSFEVLGAEVLAPRQVDGMTVSGIRFMITAFELGELEIPSFDVRVEGSDGMVTEVPTDAWAVHVRSVGLDEGGEIRAIKGPLSIARTFVSVLPWLMLLAGLIAVGVVWWRRRRRENSSHLRPVQLLKPPHEIAYQALDHLERSGLLQRGAVKDFHVSVSEIIRNYVEGRYEIFALEMTTTELVDRLWRVGIEGDLLGRFRMFLERSDLVKFAKLRPSADESRDMVAIARSLVDDTRPQMMITDAEEDDATREEEYSVPV